MFKVLKLLILLKKINPNFICRKTQEEHVTNELQRTTNSICGKSLMVYRSLLPIALGYGKAARVASN